MGTQSAVREFNYCLKKNKKMISEGRFPSNTHIHLEVSPSPHLEFGVAIAVCDAHLPDGTKSLSFKCLRDNKAPHFQQRSVYSYEDAVDVLRQMLAHTRDYTRATVTEKNFDNILHIACGWIYDSRDVHIAWRTATVYLEIQSRNSMIFAEASQGKYT